MSSLPLHRWTPLLVALAVGCASPGGEAVDPEPSSALREASGRDYLIEALLLDEPTRPMALPADALSREAAPGFDLDGLDSGQGSTAVEASCEEFLGDYHSTFHPERGGVDNVLAMLVPTIDGLFARSLAEDLAAATEGGGARLVLRVGALPEGDTPDPVIELWRVDAETTIERDGGAARPGQALEGELVARLDATADGDRVVARDAGIDGPELGLSPVLVLDFDAFRLDALGLRVTDEGVVGELGGSFDLEASVQQTIVAGGFAPEDADGVRSVLGGVADIEPTRVDPTQCGRISAGFRFAATEVELVE